MADKATTEIMDVASQLRAQREKQKLTIEAVSRDICVRSCFLEALEEGRHKDLPELTFALGFVKAYAKALKLDQKAVAKTFKQEFTDARGEETEASPDCGAAVAPKVMCELNYQVNAKPKKRWPAWLSPVVGLVGAGLSWMWIGASPATLVSTAAVDQQTEARMLAALAEAPLPQQEDTLVAAATLAAEHVDHVAAPVATSLFTPAAYAATPQPTGKSTQSIILEASEDSWIQLSYSDGTELWSGILRAGQTYRPELVGDVFLTTSNAGGILLRQYDVTHGPLGARGDVVEDFALVPSLFRNNRQAVGVGSSGSSVSSVSLAGSAGE